MVFLENGLVNAGRFFVYPHYIGYAECNGVRYWVIWSIFEGSKFGPDSSPGVYK